MNWKEDYRLQTGRSLQSFASDLVAGFMMTELWRAFAWDEIQQRYRRSVLGVLWIVVSYAIFVGGVSIFFSAFTRAEPFFYVMHVAIGYAAFTFLSGNIVDGCQVFVNSATWIKSVAMPYSIHIYRSLFRSIFTLGLQLCVAFPVMIYAGWRPELLSLMVIPALAVYLVTAVAVQYAFGLMAARFRDIDYLVTSLARLLVFVTPILWMREGLTGIRATIADFNPLTHYVEIFRAPLMGVPPRTSSWIIVLCITAGIWVVTAIVGARMRRRLAFWI